jgi:hypothetical protein
LKIIFLLLCATLAVSSIFSQAYTAESKVEILEGHTWYPGKILEVKGDQYKIHYDMYSNNIFDVWVKKDRLKPASANVNQVQAQAMSKKPVSGVGKLYSGSTINGDNIYYYMFPSGHIVMGCPTGGLENFNYSGYCNSGKGTCGVYTKNGNTISVTWNSGNTWKGSVKPNGDIEINSSLVGPVKMIPQKLSASYEFSLSMSGASVAETTTFKDNGTYEVARSSGYDHKDGKNSAEWQSSRSGKYSISGYTITLTDNSGKVSKHTIYALDAISNPDYLGWDGNFLSRRK